MNAHPLSTSHRSEWATLAAGGGLCVLLMFLTWEGVEQALEDFLTREPT